MKRTLLALCALISNIVIAQNVPNGSSFVGGVFNPTISFPSAYALPTRFNYVRTFEPHYPQTNEASVNESASTTNITMSTTYLNGFGLPLQTINWKQSSVGTRDIIVPYDNRISQHKFSFLPYVAGSGSTFQISPYTDQSAYYASNYPFDAGLGMSESSYSSSAGHRTVVKYAPGIAGVGYMKGTNITSHSNVTNEVIIWKINAITGWPEKVGYYTPYTLSKKIVANSDGGQVSEFYDNEGKLIARSQKASVTDCNLVSVTASSAEVGAAHTFLPGTTELYSVDEQKYFLGKEVYEDEMEESEAESTIAQNYDSLQNPQPNPWLPQSYPVPFTTKIKLAPINKCPTYILTYFVYDIYERLSYTLHPKAVEYLSANAWIPTSDIISNLCDFYVYDEFDRVVEKHVAGETGNEEIVYDSHSRQALIKKPTDGGVWHWSHYDKLNRVIEAGTWTDLRSRNILQSYYDLHTLPASETSTGKLLYWLFHEALQGLRIGAPVASCEFHASNFYDSYDNIAYYDGTTTHALSFLYDNTMYSGYTASGPEAIPLPSIPSTKTKGLLTCSIKKIMKPGVIPSLSDYISSANFYDSRARIVQNVQNNAVGGQDILVTQFDFKGNILRSIANYNNPLCTAQPNTKIVQTYNYNGYSHTLAFVTQSIDGAAARTIASYRYDDLNRMIKKKIGDGVEVQNIKYNIRGQLSGINPKYATAGEKGGEAMTFGVKLHYEDGFTRPIYCGAISGIIWKMNDQPSEAYGYTYDYAGRMVQADYREYSGGTPMSGGPFSGVAPTWNNSMKDYTETYMNYDNNGNLKSLKRYGPVTSSSTITPGLIDNLAYNYETSDKSNRIKSVNDAIITSVTTSLPYDFKDVNTTTTDYSYDNNGNTTGDLNKQVTTAYNFFSKPVQVSFANGDNIKYVYTAGGEKISELQYKNATATTTQTDYVGAVQFKNNAMHIIAHSEGFAKKNGSNYDYYYYVRDHLGNVRNLLLAISTSGEPAFMPPVVYEATHETDAASVEEAVFDNISYVRANKPGSIDSTDLKAAELDASDTSKMVGTSLLLKVMAGDMFEVNAESYYSSADFTSPTYAAPGQLLSSLIGTMISGAGAASNADANHVAELSKLFTANNIDIYNAIFDSSGNTGDSSIPLAFINYIQFDEDFNIVPEGCDRFQIDGTPDSWMSFGSKNPIKIVTSGYVNIFISVHTGGGVILIDPVTVKYYKGSLMESKRYYPYGLPVEIATALTPGHPENKYLYQTKMQERMNNLYLQDFHARQYDPQLGRFTSIDPAGQFSSGYVGMGNNPAISVDPDGEIAHIIIGAVVGGIFNLGMKAVQGKIQTFEDGLIAFGIGATAGAVGAATGGIAFAAAGGAAGGAGGFAAGALAGGVGTAFSAPILSTGNTFYFQDPMMTGKEYLLSVAVGALFAGTVNGVDAYMNGKNVWSGARVNIGRNQFSFNNTPVENSIKSGNLSSSELTVEKFGNNPEVSLDENAIRNKFQHALAKNRWEKAGFDSKQFTDEAMNFLSRNKATLLPGDNQWFGTINNQPVTFRINVDPANMSIRNFNAFPGSSGRILGNFIDFGKFW